MSIRIMTAVWDTTLPDSEKIVLLALADCANDEGLCWPSMATLAAKCSKSDRTVQAAIKSLVDGQHLTREEKPGKGCRYIVHPRSDCTPERASPPKRLRPEAAAPPKGTTPTPEAASDKPSRTITPPPVKAEALPTPAGGSAAGDDDSGDGKPPKADPPTKPTRKRAVGSRLPADWQAPPIAELPLQVQQIVSQWPAGAYELTALGFRNHWAAEGRAQGAKRDWPAAWCNWLIRESPHILRSVRAGQRYDAAAPGPVKTPEQAQADEEVITLVLRLKGKENEDLRKVRSLVKQEIGAGAYDGWVKQTAMRVVGDELRVGSQSSFMASWCEQHFETAFRRAAGIVLDPDMVVRFSVVKPPGQPAGREKVDA